MNSLGSREGVARRLDEGTPLGVSAKSLPLSVLRNNLARPPKAQIPPTPPKRVRYISYLTRFVCMGELLESSFNTSVFFNPHDYFAVNVVPIITAVIGDIFLFFNIVIARSIYQIAVV